MSKLEPVVIEVECQHTGHPIVASAERGETWVWCYPDEQGLAP